MAPGGCSTSQPMISEIAGQEVYSASTEEGLSISPPPPAPSTEDDLADLPQGWRTAAVRDRLRRGITARLA